MFFGILVSHLIYLFWVFDDQSENFWWPGWNSVMVYSNIFKLWNFLFSRFRGNCFSFNSGKYWSNTPNETKFSYLAGYNYGLQLTFYTNQNDKLDIFIKESGLQLKIENTSKSIDSHNGYEISSGFKTKIAIERIYKIYLPKPYSNCDFYNDEKPLMDNYELYDLIYHSKYDYEQQLCISI